MGPNLKELRVWMYEQILQRSCAKRGRGRGGGGGGSVKPHQIGDCCGIFFGDEDVCSLFPWRYTIDSLSNGYQNTQLSELGGPNLSKPTLCIHIVLSINVQLSTPRKVSTAFVFRTGVQLCII